MRTARGRIPQSGAERLESPILCTENRDNGLGQIRAEQSFRSIEPTAIQFDDERTSVVVIVDADPQPYEFLESAGPQRYPGQSVALTTSLHLSAGEEGEELGRAYLLPRYGRVGRGGLDRDSHAEQDIVQDNGKPTDVRCGGCRRHGATAVRNHVIGLNLVEAAPIRFGPFELADVSPSPAEENGCTEGDLVIVRELSAQQLTLNGRIRFGIDAHVDRFDRRNDIGGAIRRDERDGFPRIPARGECSGQAGVKLRHDRVISVVLGSRSLSEAVETRVNGNDDDRSAPARVLFRTVARSE